MLLVPNTDAVTDRCENVRIINARTASQRNREHYKEDI
jgi:uncharacterized DUF497 family protein